MIKRVILFLLVTLMATSAMAKDPVGEPQRLFRIERNKNANIVVYDAMVDTAGNLVEKDPVDVYWLKLAEDGERKGLKGIEKRMAYGFKEKEREGNVLIIEMVADIGRLITIEPKEGEYRALIRINGRQAVLEKVFIFADDGFIPSVEYIELFGTDSETGEEAYQKFLP